MQARLRSLFNFCQYVPKDKIEKARIQANINNQRYRILQQFNIARNNNNTNGPVGNFKINKDDLVYVDRCEIETRILKRLYNSEILNIQNFAFENDLHEHYKVDSLNKVVILTEIENEFTTVFEDRVFQSVRSLREIVDILARDEKIF